MTPYIRLRGCALLSGWSDAAFAPLKPELTAQPAAPSGYPTRASFPLYLRISSGWLVPRYAAAVLRSAKQVAVRHDPPTTTETDRVWSEKYPLRPGQRDGAEQAERVLRAERGCLLKGDTGSGKTVVGLHLIHRLRPATVLVLVDQLDIVTQWAERVRQFLPQTALRFLLPKAVATELGRKYPDPSEPDPGTFTIGTVQSLLASKQYTATEPFACDLLLCDEVHVFAAPVFSGAMRSVDFHYALGLTATDDRKDGLEWVFRAYLGPTVVSFAGEVLTPRVFQALAPSGGLHADDYRTNWCRRLHSRTTPTRCVACPYFPRFPECGGALPRTVRNEVVWDRKIDRMGLLQAWTAKLEYLAWLHDSVITPLVAKDRRLFVFGELREFLEEMHRRGQETFGDDKVGLYLGQRGARESIALRKAALSKQVTYCTYGVARKALDVPDKDVAVFGTPIADGRQAAGRVRRTAPNKPVPLIVVPVPNIGPFIGTWRKLSRQFKDQGWTITTW